MREGLDVGLDFSRFIRAVCIHRLFGRDGPLAPDELGPENRDGRAAGRPMGPAEITGRRQPTPDTALARFFMPAASEHHGRVKGCRHAHSSRQRSADSAAGMGGAASPPQRYSHDRIQYSPSRMWGPGYPTSKRAGESTFARFHSVEADCQGGSKTRVFSSYSAVAGEAC